ncbi:MAG: discoidin domain-containing protein [Planctomycetales bacterium]|nr:discoidin domain-containing protein [Planctomycetales bacterium]
MKATLVALVLAALALVVWGDAARGAGLLAPGDAIIAIDLDPIISESGYPGGEAPQFAVDGTLAKYLNFKGFNVGFIVTPNLGAASIAEALRLTTANDAEDRDPASYEIWGTNDAIVSADNSTGLGENWTLLSSGGLSLPAARDTVDALIPFANTDLYTSYKFIFPTNKGSNLFQIAEVELFGDVPSLAMSDVDLLNAGDSVLAVQYGPDSRFPSGENPGNLLDGNVDTKYLNFGAANSGFIVTPAGGPSVVTNFRISTANDFDNRDPTSYEIYGTNDVVLSQENSRSDGGENWTLITAGSIALPTDRKVDGPLVEFANTDAYASYRVVFPTLGLDPNSMQISEFQFNWVPEPSSVALGLFAVAACGCASRRRLVRG